MNREEQALDAMRAGLARAAEFERAGDHTLAQAAGVKAASDLGFALAMGAGRKPCTCAQWAFPHRRDRHCEETESGDDVRREDEAASRAMDAGNARAINRGSLA